MHLSFVLVITKLSIQLVRRGSALLRPPQWPERSLLHQAEFIVTATEA